MRFVVLGCSGSHGSPGRMCSSYLVEHEDTRFVMDCGNGSLSNLMAETDLADVDGVWLSHLHPDHMADVFGLHYALRFHPDGPLSVPLYGPAATMQRVGALTDPESFGEALPFTPVAAGDRFDVGALSVELFAAHHPVETCAARVRGSDRVVAYSGDSAPTPALVACARDADLFACDSTWSAQLADLPPGIHCTARQAGEQAASAGAARLLVTHVAHPQDPVALGEEAAEVFDGEVLVAADRMVVQW